MQGPRPQGVAGQPVCRKAETSRPGQIGAPMPGFVSTVAVAAGQTVEALLSIEAMKM
jgi:pyruvate carboxylase